MVSTLVLQHIGEDYTKEEVKQEQPSSAGGGKKRQREVEIVLNIEIDGPHHQRHSHHYFDELRDAHLSRNYDVKVVRVDLTTITLDLARKFFQDVYNRHLLPTIESIRYSIESQTSINSML